MNVSIFLAIALASCINSMMPGPCVALTICRSARNGVLAGLTVASGVVIANLILASIAMLVLIGAFAVDQTLMEAIRWLGAAAFLWLAFRLLNSTGQSIDNEKSGAGTFIKDAVSGLVVGLSSPYNLVFLIGLLPQFFSTEAVGPVIFAAALLAVLIGAQVAMFGVTWLGVASKRISAGSSHIVEKVGAVAMIGFAAVAVCSTVG